MDDPDTFGDISRMHQKQITIHEGDEGLAETGRVLYVEPDWTTDDLLQAAGRRLELVTTPKRMFNCNGMEVGDVMMIEDREVIFFTQGGEYVAPLLQSNAGGDGGSSGSSSGLPAIVGAYKVCEFLGKGGFGEVRVGEHQLTGERVALKFLRKSAIADMGAAERTTTEIQCLTALKHPNIIRLVQHINSPQNVIMVFELAAGGDLFQFLCGAPGQRVDEEEGRALVRQIVSGVGYAHNQHICHRDMKLDNVLLSRRGCLREIKLADFGLSDFYRPGATMRTNCGSISYLAPEVFRGTSNAGPPLDVWSIGVILFALLCGRLPFEGSDLQGTNRPREAAIRRRIMECRYKPADSLSPEAKDLMRRMLKLDPNERASIPEIFNHSWLRFRNVTSLDQQPGRKDERGGLRDAFQDGASGGSPRGSYDGGGRGGPGGSPRPRGSNSPRLAPLSPRSTTPQAECKAPESPRRSGQGSPRRSQMVLDPLEPKRSGALWTSPVAAGLDAGGASTDEAAAEAMPVSTAEGPAESKRLSGRRDEGAYGHLHHDRDDGFGGETEGFQGGDHDDTDSDESQASRAGPGGRGRDFSIVLNPVRGGVVTAHNQGNSCGRGSSPGGPNTKEPMIRMNSRLGLTQPARKTMSAFGLAPGGGSGGSGGGTTGIAAISTTFIATVSGGAARSRSTSGGRGNTSGDAGGGARVRSPGVLKSRTIDLSHHLTSSSQSSPSALASSMPHLSMRSESPSLSTQKRGSGTIRPRNWHSRDDDDDGDIVDGDDDDRVGIVDDGSGDHRNRHQGSPRSSREGRNQGREGQHEEGAHTLRGGGDGGDGGGEYGHAQDSANSLLPRLSQNKTFEIDGRERYPGGHERHHADGDSNSSRASRSPTRRPRKSLNESGSNNGGGKGFEQNAGDVEDDGGGYSSSRRGERKSPRGSAGSSLCSGGSPRLSWSWSRPSTSPPGTADGNGGRDGRSSGDGGGNGGGKCDGWDGSRGDWDDWNERGGGREKEDRRRHECEDSDNDHRGSPRLPSPTSQSSRGGASHREEGPKSLFASAGVGDTGEGSTCKSRERPFRAKASSLEPDDETKDDGEHQHQQRSGTPPIRTTGVQDHHLKGPRDGDSKWSRVPSEEFKLPKSPNSSALQQQQQRDTNNVLDGKHSVDDGSTRLTDATEGVWKDGRHRFGDRRADEVSPAVSTAAGRISALAGATVPAAMLSSSTSTIAATTLCVERDKIEVVRGDPNNER